MPVAVGGGPGSRRSMGRDPTLGICPHWHTGSFSRAPWGPVCLGGAGEGGQAAPWRPRPLLTGSSEGCGGAAQGPWSWRRCRCPSRAQPPLASAWPSVHRFHVAVAPGTKLESGPATLHLCNGVLAVAKDIPPAVTGQWRLSDLRRYGAVPNGFIFEGGTRCGYCKYAGWAGPWQLPAHFPQPPPLGARGPTVSLLCSASGCGWVPSYGPAASLFLAGGTPARGCHVTVHSPWPGSQGLRTTEVRI